MSSFIAWEISWDIFNSYDISIKFIIINKEILISTIYHNESVHVMIVTEFFKKGNLNGHFEAVHKGKEAITCKYCGLSFFCKAIS